MNHKDFEKFFQSTTLPRCIKKVKKTLSKRECEEIFYYFDQHRPQTMIELGTQYGCSTKIFVEIANFFGYKLNMHAFDIRDRIRSSIVDRNEFHLHIEDITDKELETLDLYSPDLVFLDAHPYKLTKNMVNACLRKQINFMCHDISLDVHEKARQQSNNFTNFDIYVAWELYVIAKIISDKFLTEDYYEDKERKIIGKCTRDKYGLFVLTHETI
jgi:hypothetical protein